VLRRAMTDSWRPILQQLTNELERQTQRLRELEAQRLVDLSVSLNGRRSMASMASMPDSPTNRRTITASTEVPLEAAEATVQPAEVWAEKTQEAMDHEKSEEDEKQDWKARIRSRASTFDFSSLRLIRATRTTRSRPGESAIKKKPKYVINPQSNRYAYWQLLTTVALGFVVIVVPYQVGLLELQWDVLMAVSCVVDLVFVTDMVIQFFTCTPIPRRVGFNGRTASAKLRSTTCAPGSPWTC